MQFLIFNWLKALTLPTSPPAKGTLFFFASSYVFATFKSTKQFSIHVIPWHCPTIPPTGLQALISTFPLTAQFVILALSCVYLAIAPVSFSPLSISTCTLRFFTVPVTTENNGCFSPLISYPRPSNVLLKFDALHSPASLKSIFSPNAKYPCRLPYLLYFVPCVITLTQSPEL